MTGAFLGFFLVFLPLIMILLMVGAFFLAVILLFLYLLLNYIFESISIMNISKNLKYNNKLFAWIPFYNKYYLTKMIGCKILGLILTLFNITIFSGFIYCYIQSDLSYTFFIILLICLLVKFILDIIISDKVYKKATKKYSDLLTIINVFTLGFFRTIFIFIFRNKIKN